ncbi:hypothetical protein LGQ03_08710 [Loktanella sp. TSTF-M6]|uniref:Uncharacterized protein n=1 Tax=Loktanella gaetbuli TaxID=2881335 RepID=A0ABS8BUY3_9RHOB|nr:hypothetical protein [Loktanella gaetbuli]MCB5199321.1 hypothetical protein [Loktanella gaetbuli]
MIVSRFVARRRIAAGVRPGWFAAWGLVALDALMLLAVLGLMFMPVMSLIYASQPSVIVTVGIFFVLFFLPIQVVLILSSLWAAKSRYVGSDDKFTTL